jgi:hypothetical protein
LRQLLDVLGRHSKFHGIEDALSFVVRGGADGLPRYLVRRTSAIAIQQQPPHEQQPWHARLPVHPPLPAGLVVRVRDMHTVVDVQLPAGAPHVATMPRLTQVGGQHGLNDEAMRQLCFADDEPDSFGTLLFSCSSVLLQRDRLVSDIQASLCIAGPLEQRCARTLSTAAAACSLPPAVQEELRHIASTRSVHSLFGDPSLLNESPRLQHLLRWWREQR